MSVTNIISSSQSNFNHSAPPQPQLPSSEPPSEEEYVRVLFDYDHKPKDGKKGQPYSIKKGDMLRLIERTNAEWWKVKPEGSKKAFYVPANYVELFSKLQSPDTEVDTYANTGFMQGMPAQPPPFDTPNENLQQYANSELFKSPASSTYTAPSTVIGLSRSYAQQQPSEPDVPLTSVSSGPSTISFKPQFQPHSHTSLLSKSLAQAAAASVAQNQSPDRGLDSGASSRPTAVPASPSALLSQPAWKGSKEMLDDDVPTLGPPPAPPVSTSIAAAPPSAKNTTTINLNNLNSSLPRSVQPPQLEQNVRPAAAGATTSLSKATGAHLAAVSDVRLTDINVPSTPSASTTRPDDFSTTLPQQSTLSMQTVTKQTPTEVPVDIPVEPAPVHPVQLVGHLSFTPLKEGNKLSKSKVLVGYASVRAGRCLVYKDEKAAFLANNAAAAGKASSKKVPPPELTLELRDAQLAWNPDPALSKRNYFIFGSPTLDKKYMIQLPEVLKSSGPRNNPADDLRTWFDSFEHAKREVTDGAAAMAGKRQLSGSRDDLVSGAGAPATGALALGAPGAAVVSAGGIGAAPVLRHDSSSASASSARAWRDEHPSSLVQTGPGATASIASAKPHPWPAASAVAASASAATPAAADKKPKNKKEEEKLRKEQEKAEKEKGSIFDRLTKFFAKRPTPMEMEKRGLIHDMVFGSTLVKVCENDRTLVPIFVTNCIKEVDSRGLDIDGVYRISANLSQVQKLRHFVDQSAGRCNLADWDVHVITGAMKLFLRELKDPVIDSHSLEKIYSVLTSHQMPHVEKAPRMRSELETLPRCHFETLRALILHCRKVAECHEQNRMLASNLAIVFGPTLAAPIQSGTGRLDTGPAAAGGPAATSGGSGKGPQKKRLPAGAGVSGPVQIGGPLPGPAPEQQQGDPFVSSAMYLGVIFEFLVNNSEAVFGSSL